MNDIKDFMEGVRLAREKPVPPLVVGPGTAAKLREQGVEVTEWAGAVDDLERLRTRVREQDATILRMKLRTAPLLTLLLAEFEYDGEEPVTECAARILLEQRAEIARLREGR